MLKKKKPLGTKITVSTLILMFVLGGFSHFGLRQNLKLWKKKCGFFFNVVGKDVESPRKYVQYLSEMLLLGNQNTNRRFQKPFLWPKSQGRLQIVQYMIWEGHSCLRKILFLFIKSSNGNWTPTFPNSSGMGIEMQGS